MRCRVQRIKPDQPGFERLEAAVYPWISEMVSGRKGMGFVSHRLALHYAVTGEVLEPTPEELAARRPRVAAWRERINAEEAHLSPEERAERRWVRMGYSEGEKEERRAHRRAIERRRETAGST